jgi:hypothetical protein
VLEASFFKKLLKFEEFKTQHGSQNAILVNITHILQFKDPLRKVLEIVLPDTRVRLTGLWCPAIYTRLVIHLKSPQRL